MTAWIDRVLTLDNLRLAWEEVADKRGAPGIDEISVKRWRRNWEERIVELVKAVRTDTYRPSKPKTFKRQKSDGSFRHISILTVTDRVLQRSVLRVVDDIFDRGFLDTSYGYRAGRGVRTAVPAILEHRDAGRQWVLDADIDDCFGSLDHSIIKYLFQQIIDDAVLHRLLNQWINMGQQVESRPRGILLGAVISPLLCNIYLHQLDLSLMSAGFKSVRYADDFCVFCANHAEAYAAFECTKNALSNLRLNLEYNKTTITRFDAGFDFLGVHFYRDTYSFTANKKKIEVKGKFHPAIFYDYLPEGYED